MSGRGRKAVLPPADHRVEPPLAQEGLVVAVVNKAGFTKEFDFAQLSAPEAMQRALAVAFATRSRSWNSHLTAITCWDKIVIFVRFLSELENPPGDLDDLTVAALKRWRTLHVGTNTGRLTLTVIRKLLQQEPRLATGPVAEELSRRIPAPEPSKQSFGKNERERMALAAQRQFRSAWMRIRENSALLDSWRSGALAEGSREWKIGAVLDHLARTGDVPRTVLPSGQVYVTHRRLLGGANAEKSWGRLFLTPRELTALAVLLTDRFGWNLSVYSRMPAPTAAPSAGDRASVTYQVEIEKRRTGGGRWFSTENITDSGADSSGRLITQALEATVHGRVLAARLAPGTDFLMVMRSHNSLRDTQNMDRPRPVGPLAFGVTDDDAKRWGRENQLGGSPFQRSRRTTVTGEGRPLQHTQGTHESVYMLPDQHVQRASRDVFEAGALEALDQARTVVFGGLLADTPDPDHQEAAVADCADETTSPWPAPDGGCRADFLLCLGCPNAHVHPGHHPRLAHLHKQLRSLRSVLEDGSWNKQWRDPLLRLDDLRDKVGAPAWNAALARTSEDDRLLVTLLLKNELGS